MPLPILGWVAVAVTTATVAYLASDDDSSSSSSSDRDEREQEAKRQAKEEKNKKIRDEIRKYKDNQSLQIKEKYGAIIEFISEDLGHNNISSINLAVGIFDNASIKNEYKVNLISKDKTQQNKFNNLKKEIKELKETIKELEVIKNNVLK